jgi:hypothetical protein
MKSRLTTYGLWTVSAIILIGLIGCIILLSTFDIFAAPEKKALSNKCDYEGLREVEMYKLEGNVVTNASIHVAVHLGCGNYQAKDEHTIFTVENSALADNDVSINLIGFDTLAIAYKRGLRIFTKLDRITYADSTLNLNVTYKEVE